MASGRAAICLWWGINIALVLFVFLAFLFAALDYQEEKSIETNVSNIYHVYNSGPDSLTRNYTVAPNHDIKQGNMVSYVDNGQIGRGLGPEWSIASFIPGFFYGAGSADVDSLITTSGAYVYSVYAFTPVSNRQQLNVQGFSVSGNKTSLGASYFITLTATYNISRVMVRGVDAFTFAVVTEGWESGTQAGSNVFVAYLIGGRFSTDYGSITLSTPTAFPLIQQYIFNVDMFAIPDQTGLKPNWLVVTYGNPLNNIPCVTNIYVPDKNNFLAVATGINNGFAIECTHPLNSLYLGNGFFTVANGVMIGLGQANIDKNEIVSLQLEPFGQHLYEVLRLVAIPDRQLIVAYGVQMEGLEAPKLMTQVISWSQTGFDRPYLIPSSAIILLPSSTRLELDRYHVRAAYTPPDTYHPMGCLVFTYVDIWTGYPSLVRGSLIQYSGSWYVLSSARVSISNMPYYNQLINNAYGPLIINAGGKLTVFLQSSMTINTFHWWGGYRVAGVALADGSQGQVVPVLRIGVINTMTDLLTGFSYYFDSLGYLHSTISSSEMYTNFGIPYRVGVALSDTRLLLDYLVVERLNDGY